MTNDILIKEVRGEKFKDQVFVIFYREGNISNPLFITTKTHAEALARQILGIPEGHDVIHVAPDQMETEVLMCGWCKKKEATGYICSDCWRRLG